MSQFFISTIVHGVFINRMLYINALWKYSYSHGLLDLIFRKKKNRPSKMCPTADHFPAGRRNKYTAYTVCYLLYVLCNESFEPLEFNQNVTINWWSISPMSQLFCKFWFRSQAKNALYLIIQINWELLKFVTIQFFKQWLILHEVNFTSS